MLQGYLDWLENSHSKLKGWRTSDKQAPEVLLDSAYVALRAEMSSAFEGQRNKELLAAEVAQAIGDIPDLDNRWARVIARHPLSDNLKERSKQKLFSRTGETLTELGQAFREFRSLVILGDPGSGKTTVARWLTLKFARAKRQARDKVRVLKHQIDPDEEVGTEEFDLGPTRLPVLIRVADFAEFMRINPAENLLTFLGNDVSYGRPTYPAGHPQHGHPIESERINQMIGHHLDQNDALILLDGLDEIATAEVRERVLRNIEQFVSDFVEKMPTSGPPLIAGGNQVLTTSRIIGYAANRIERDIRHFTIEPLGERAVRYFCRTWLRAVHQSNNRGNLAPAALEALAEQDARQLESQIFDAKRPRLRELASNPLLISVLAAIFLNRGRRLPDNRVELYKIAVEGNLVEVWKARDRGFDCSAVLKLLEALAAELHENYSQGLIDHGRIEKFIGNYLQALAPGKTTLTSEQFLRAVKLDAGLLAERGRDMYGFLHLTFQEYFAGRFLIRDKGTAATLIRRWVCDPRWREVLVLALGQISLDWHEAEFCQLLIDLIEVRDRGEEESLAGIMLVVGAMDDNVLIPQPALRALVARMLRSYAERASAPQFQGFRDGLEGILRKWISGRLDTQDKRGRDNLTTVESAFCEALNGPEALLCASTARLTRSLDFFTDATTDALHSAIGKDREDFDWPVHRAIESLALFPLKQKLLNAAAVKSFPAGLAATFTAAEVAGLSQIKISSQTAGPEGRADFVPTPAKANSLRMLLQSDPVLVDRINREPPLFRLIVSLYGGLGDLGVVELQEAINGDAEVLQFGDFDAKTIAQLAARLDTDLEPRLIQLKAVLPQLRPENIQRDSELTEIISEFLQTSLPLPELVQRFRRIAGLGVKTGAGSYPALARAEAVIGLIALGEPVQEVLQSVIAAGDERLADQIRERSALLASLLKDPLHRAQTELKKLELGRLAEHDRFTLIPLLIEVVSNAGAPPIPVIDWPVPLAAPAIFAEQLSFMLSGVGDDPTYSLAVSLDTIGRKLAKDPQALLDALCGLNEARNNAWPQHRFRRDTLIQTRPSTLSAKLFHALRAIESFAPEYDFARSWAIQSLAPLKATTEGAGLTSLLLAWAVTVLESPVSREETLERIDASILPLSPTERVRHTLRLADESAPPYARFLVHLRFPVIQRQNYPKFLEKLRGLADSIPDPYERWSAYNELQGIPLDEKTVQAAVANLKEAALAVQGDHECRAGVLMASAAMVPQGHETLLSQALKSIDAIPDSGRRAQLLREFREKCDPSPELETKWRASVGQISREPENALAKGLISPLLLSGGEFAGQTTPVWGVITLSAMARDMINLLSKARRGEQWWEGLEQTATREKSLTELRRAAESGKLTLTSRAAAVLEAMSVTAIATLEDIITRFTQFDPSTAVLLHRWIEQRSGLLPNVVAVLLAESGDFNPSVIRRLVSILAGEHDFLRVRASLAMYGSAAGENLKASELSYETLVEMARLRDAHRKTQPGITLAINWAFERVTFDEPEMLRRAQEDLQKMPAASNPASTLINSIHRASPSVWETMLAGLEHPKEEIRLAWLDAVYLTIAKGRAEQPSKTAAVRLRERLRGLIQSDRCRAVQKRAVLALGHAGGEEADFAMLTNCVENGNHLARIAMTALGWLIRRNSLPTQTRLVLLKLSIDWLSATKNGPAGTGSDQRIIFSRQVGFVEMLARARFSPEHILQLVGDQAPVLFGLVAATEHRFIGADFDRGVAAAAGFLHRHGSHQVAYGGEMVSLFDRLFLKLNEHLKDQQEFDQSIPPEDQLFCLLSVAAAAAEDNPAAFRSIAKTPELGDAFSNLLRKAVEIHGTFPGRRAAMVLLSFLGVLNEATVRVLCAALRDVPPVRQAAIASICRYTEVTPTVLENIERCLASKGALEAFALTEILAAVAENNELEPGRRREVRESLIEALRRAIKKPGTRRQVFTLTYSSWDYAFHVRELGWLNQLFHHQLLKVTSPEISAGNNRSSRASGHREIRFLVPCVFDNETRNVELAASNLPFKEACLGRQTKQVIEVFGGSLPAGFAEAVAKIRTNASEAKLDLADLLTGAFTWAREVTPITTLSEHVPGQTQTLP